MNKKGNASIPWEAIFIFILLFILLSFFWINNKDIVKDYNSLQLKYTELNENYTQLKQECTELLKDYESCVGRETFFVWIDRFLSLRNIARLVGLI